MHECYAIAELQQAQLVKTVWLFWMSVVQEHRQLRLDKIPVLSQQNFALGTLVLANNAKHCHRPEVDATLAREGSSLTAICTSSAKAS